MAINQEQSGIFCWGRRVRSSHIGQTSRRSLEKVDQVDNVDTQAAAAHSNALSVGTLMERMEIVVTEASGEQVVATMPVAGNTQPMGLLHGGATAVLIESVGSIGANITAAPDGVAVGAELNVTHHRPGTAGLVTGTATRIHRGKQTACYEVIVTNEDGQRLATGRLTCFLKPKTTT